MVTSATNPTVTNHSRTRPGRRLSDLLQSALLVGALPLAEGDLHDHRRENEVNSPVRQEPGSSEQSYRLALDDVLRRFGHIGHGLDHASSQTNPPPLARILDSAPICPA